MLNTICLQGRLTADPELRTTATGSEVARFTLAVEENRASQDGTRPTNFIDCEVWGNSASMVQKYFEKGQMMAVSGMLRVRAYKNKEGKTMKSVTVVCNNVNFCGTKTQTPTEQKKQKPEVYQAQQMEFDNNFEPVDLPF